MPEHQRAGLSADEMAAPSPPCPSSPDGKHGPDWREWRVAEREGRPIPCEYCGVIVWPVCSTCQKPRVNWERHGH